jgi:hypothetical protein
VAVTAFGATTASNYALSGFVDWRIAAFFIAGGLLGGLLGTLAGRRLGQAKGRLATIFALFVIITGLYVIWKGAGALL